MNECTESDQMVFIPTLVGALDGLVYGSTEINGILKEKWCFLVVGVNALMSSYSRHQGRASMKGSSVPSDFAYLRDVACLIVLQWLGKVPFAYVMHYPEYPSIFGSSCRSYTVQRVLSVERLCKQQWLR